MVATGTRFNPSIVAENAREANANCKSSAKYDGGGIALPCAIMTLRLQRTAPSYGDQIFAGFGHKARTTLEHAVLRSVPSDPRGQDAQSCSPRAYPRLKSTVPSFGRGFRRWGYMPYGEPWAYLKCDSDEYGCSRTGSTLYYRSSLQ